jgi:hypothetical protein
MRSSLTRAITMAAFCGLGVLVVALPLLVLVHRAFQLGNPPLDGVLVLGGSVVLCFVLAGVMGHFMGTSGNRPALAALLGLLLGITNGFLVAPIYAGMVVDGLTRDATGLVWSERQGIESAVRGVASTHGTQAWNAMREGRLQQQLGEYRKQAAEATTSEGRAAALNKANELGAQMALIAKTKGIALLKMGIARALAFTLLLWAVVGSPIMAGVLYLRVSTIMIARPGIEKLTPA